MRQNALKPGKN